MSHAPAIVRSAAQERIVNYIVHIAVAGNIGAGKTTLTNMLADHYGWEKRLEPVVENPYMEDSDHTIIQDRSIFEGVYVFTENNYRQGNLSETDFKTYMELFELMVRVTKYPDLLIYLRKSVPQLVRQIQLRGREYEQTMQLEYLKGLNERYEDFIFNRYKGRVLVIESDGMDFQHNPKDFGKIIDKIDAELFGLFSHVEKSLFAEKGL